MAGILCSQNVWIARKKVNKRRSNREMIWGEEQKRWIMHVKWYYVGSPFTSFSNILLFGRGCDFLYLMPTQISYHFVLIKVSNWIYQRKHCLLSLQLEEVMYAY